MDGIRVPFTANEVADKVKVVESTCAMFHVTEPAVPACVISLTVKLLALIASENTTVNLTGSTSVEAACPDASAIVTVGSVLSSVYVSSFAAGGSVAAKGFPSRPVIVGEFKFNPTEPLKLISAPPENVTSYILSFTRTTDAGSPIALVATKSFVLTVAGSTSSLNVTRKVRLLAFVRVAVGSRRTKEITVGSAPLSITILLFAPSDPAAPGLGNVKIAFPATPTIEPPFNVRAFVET